MRFRFICQYDSSDCGAACMAMICRFYGLKTTVTRMREIIKTDKNGTSGFGIVSGCQKLNLKVMAVRLEDKNLGKEVPLPCIAQVLTEYGDHYVVVCGQKKGKLTIADPSKGMIKKTPQEFAKQWTGVLFLIEPGAGFCPNKTKGVAGRIWALAREELGFKTGGSKETKRKNKEEKSQSLKLKSSMLWLFVLSVLGLALGLLGSLYYKVLIDDVLPKGSLPAVKTATAVFALIGILETLVLTTRSYFLELLGQKIDTRLVFSYFEHLLELPIGFFKTREPGEILARFGDIYKIKEILVNTLVDGSLDIILLVGCGVALCVISAPLFLITLLTLLVHCALVLGFQGRIKRLIKDQIEQDANLETVLVEAVLGAETIKACGIEGQLTKKFMGILKVCQKKDKALSKVLALEFSLVDLVAGLGRFFLLCLGVCEVVKGRISLGTFLTFNSLLAFFWQSASGLISLQATLQTMWVSLCRAFEVLDLPAEPRTGKRPQNLLLPIVFEDVCFRYGSRRQVLQGFSMELDAGAKVAIVGANGSGKSTVAKLLMNFYKPESGTIRLGQHKLQELAPPFLRQKIAYLTQDAVLFKGSLEENLKQKNPQILDLEFYEICKLCEIDRFVKALPGGYKFMVNDSGANFSGGQKQLLALARAIMLRPDVLILDEATSNVDSITEKKVLQMLFGRLEKSTIIIITHKLPLALACQKIFVFEAGRLVGQGSSEELEKTCPTYKQLWEDYGG